MSNTPLAVGLVGAGPWAEKAYAPMLAAGPETALACVWTRRPEQATRLAAAHGAEAASDFAALLSRCDAVAFAVPPDVQAELGIRAARAGRHLLLDKPLALTFAGAQALADAVADAGVVSQLMLTHRYRASTAAFLGEARAFESIGAQLSFLSGAFVRGPYATGWRREHGALHDLGPHAFDLLDAALGPIEHISGAGDPRAWVSLVCRHASGGVSELSLTGVMSRPQSVFRFDVHGRDRTLTFDGVAASSEAPWALARRTFAEAVRSGRPPELDVRRGLLLQRLIDEALRAIAS